MKKLINILLYLVVTILFTVLVILVFTSILGRFFGLFTGLTEIAEEASRFLFIWLSFMGAVIALKERMHIRIEILLEFIPHRFKRIVLTIADIMTLGFLVVVAIYGMKLLPYTTQKSPAMGLGMWVIYLCVPISCVLSVGYLIPQMVERFKK